MVCDRWEVIVIRIYTRTGDQGETGLWRNRRVGKGSLRVHAIGAVDECNTVIGLALCEQLPSVVVDVVKPAQSVLFVVGTELMVPPGADPGDDLPRLSDADVTRLERAIDSLQARLPDVRSFVLPGGSRAAAVLHHARAVCRRSERATAELNEAETVSSVVMTYLNRLSDLLYVAARYCNHEDGVGDVEWSRRTMGRT